MRVPEVRFPVAVTGGVPVVAAPEEIDITNADALRAALLEAAAAAGRAAMTARDRERRLVSADTRGARGDDAAISPIPHR